MSIGAAVTGPIDRSVHSATRSVSGRTLARHILAIVAVAGTVTALELPATDLDHGTHLLVLLTIVMAVALLLGPRPATSGLVAGGGLAGIASLVTVQGALGMPHAYIQLLAYVLAGGAFIVLLSAARRSLPRPAGPPPATSAKCSSIPGLAEQLTAREVEVLRLAASGITVDEIAQRLYVSPNTVKTHLTHVYGKLGVRGRSDAVRAALHCGCLTPADICPHMLESGRAEVTGSGDGGAPEGMTTARPTAPTL